ncbi:MAG: copper-binding protein [Candidatus Nitrosotenuis sp.]|jgi:putative copper export protein|nr:copper-binding protein [Candidatus Nitrosotenuis sp.]
MMAIEQAVITWIHLVASAVWVGGSLFIAMVFAPVLKTMSSSVEDRLQIMIRVGRKFNRIAIPSLMILIATGIFNAHQMLIKPDFLFSTSYGVLLVIKIVFVVGLLVAFGIHVRIIRKEVEQKITEKQLSDSQITRLRTKIIIVGQVTVILSVAILFMAALLDAGI